MKEKSSNQRSPGSGRRGRNYTGFAVQQMHRAEKKSLEPLLMRMLPRRAKGMERSSYYRQLRIALLPDNPYFLQDVRDLRELFNISTRQIEKIDLMLYPERERPSGKFAPPRLEDVASFWLEIHRDHFLKIPLGDWIPPLPQWFVDSAHTAPAFGESAQLSWLKKEPNISERFANYFNPAVPLERCAARLIERYQLPWSCGVNLQRYIMTGRVAYLKSIFFLDIRTDSVVTGIGEAFSITVDGIDEFVTKQQWDQVFKRYVKPQQDSYFERRGEVPHSRQIALNVLTKPEILDIYDYIYTQELTGRVCGVDRAIESLSKEGKLPLSKEGKLPPEAEVMDRKAAFRTIRNLRTLFQPCD